MSDRPSLSNSLKVFFSALLALSPLACKPPVIPPYQEGASFKADLEAIRGKKIFFAHQSVGRNILAGLKEIAPDLGADLQDVEIGKNEDPVGKCEDFIRNLDRLGKNPPDIALLKFCYVDFNVNTDPAALFERYSQTLEGLQKRYPKTTFVPVTTSLTIRPYRKELLLSALRRKTAESDLINLKREQFNDLLRQKYAGQTIFDLAAFESTFPDGSRNAFESRGQKGYALIDAYSDDGGHLNEDARKRGAEAFVHALAEAARAKSARVSPL